jgi:hypothetical protein
MKQVKQKKCKICRELFTPHYSSFQKTCGISCAKEEGKMIVEKERAKAWTKEKKEWSEKLMTLSNYIQLLQPIFNRYIVLRDKNDPCISCRTTKNVQYCASHYFNTKTFGNLRFDEENVHKACNQYCNGQLSGNLIPYRKYLIEKIGIDRFTALESRQNEVRKYTIPEIKELISHYRKKIKELTKQNDGL